MEEDVDIDPVFIGMTRPPMVIGVPMEFFGISFIVFGIGMILFTALSSKILFFICITLPLHACGYIATEKDPHWMSVWLTKLNKCAPTRNRGYWRSNSYRP
ncbi:MAG: VirB3 family type IV secretion system protein [Alphaproteobacteria bacterium]|nr:VirB3 family type IV secretion system protein [Alphaproteobacteria bacterium]